jgi:hypothetical protein
MSPLTFSDSSVGNTVPWGREEGSGRDLRRPRMVREGDNLRTSPQSRGEELRGWASCVLRNPPPRPPPPLK